MLILFLHVQSSFKNLIVLFQGFNTFILPKERTILKTEDILKSNNHPLSLTKKSDKAFLVRERFGSLSMNDVTFYLRIAYKSDMKGYFY